MMLSNYPQSNPSYGIGPQTASSNYRGIPSSEVSSTKKQNAPFLQVSSTPGSSSSQQQQNAYKIGLIQQQQLHSEYKKLGMISNPNSAVAAVGGGLGQSTASRNTGAGLKQS